VNSRWTGSAPIRFDFVQDLQNRTPEFLDVLLPCPDVAYRHSYDDLAVECCVRDKEISGTVDTPQQRPCSGVAPSHAEADKAHSHRGRYCQLGIARDLVY
jgi:hypothetical protein